MLDRRKVLAGVASLPFLSGVTAAAAVQPRRVIVSHIRLDQNRVWVDVRIGGRGPFPFVIDSGGGVSLIDPEFAAQLGMVRRGQRRFSGVGGPAVFPLVEARDLIFGGGISQASAIFAALPRMREIAPGAAGALAAGLLTTLDTDLDFEAGEWRVYPDGRPERSGFELLPSEIAPPSNLNDGSSDFIYVTAQIDGQGYRLVADTGMPGLLTLNPAATRRSGLWRDDRPYALNRPHGIGGRSRLGRLVRAGRLSLGGIHFDAPLIGLTQPGTAAERPADGLIGLALLERLTLSTDVRARRLWARRNARPARPERYGMSGLWIDERGGRPVVAAIAPGSPGAEAGVRVGDELVGTSFAAAIAALGQEPGSRIPQRLRRGGEEVPAELVLRPYI